MPGLRQAASHPLLQFLSQETKNNNKRGIFGFCSDDLGLKCPSKAGVLKAGLLRTVCRDRGLGKGLVHGFCDLINGLIHSCINNLMGYWKMVG